jgi:hypothetical protein
MFKGLLFGLLIFAQANDEAKSYSQDSTYKTYENEARDFADLNNKALDNFSHSVQPMVLSSGGYRYGWQFPSEIIIDSRIGRLSRPNSEIRHIARTLDEIIYDAIYTFDQFNRRVTDVPKLQTQKKFISLFGCSFTYGNALSNHQTLNYFIAKKSPNFYSYNYGIGGTSLNSALALSQRPNFFEEIPEKVGAYVYIFTSSHIGRASGILPDFIWQSYTPYYEMNSDSKLDYKGLWFKARPYYTSIVHWIHSFFGDNILRERTFPLVTSSDYEKFCRMAVDLRDLIEKNKPGSKFIFYVHPFQPEKKLKFEDCLKENRVLVYYGTPIIDLPKYTIKHDGHPNEIANKVIADELLSIVKKSGL